MQAGINIFFERCIMLNKISDAKHEFDGKNYYRCGGRGSYFKRGGKYLHRAIWEFHNGSIPEKHHIHHIDHNKENNELENLECVLGKEHNSYHSKLDKKGKSLSTEALTAAAKWHKSEEGRIWHSEHASRERPKNNLTCVQCGADMIGHYRKTCSPGCKRRYTLGQIGAPKRHKGK